MSEAAIKVLWARGADPWKRHAKNMTELPIALLRMLPEMPAVVLNNHGCSADRCHIYFVDRKFLP
ncbi:hypothetical protein BC936DRAFT_138106 [Jimgerdemannia flammicorona]|uniref:Uncharacterized protein n=1 Tax=Jimgerdemannia flammicorona TaxID=994334 RepID=A0A433CW76_9FUNG|nr:hypothetical protein BC936DRAFT_138106 [Jimgerdemannia flammicorona]